MNRIERVVGQVVYEFGRALFVSSFIGDFVELLDRVFDSLLLLTFRIDCEIGRASCRERVSSPV